MTGIIPRREVPVAGPWCYRWWDVHEKCRMQVTTQPNAKDEGWRLVCISLIRRPPKGTLCRWLHRFFWIFLILLDFVGGLVCPNRPRILRHGFATQDKFFTNTRMKRPWFGHSWPYIVPAQSPKGEGYSWRVCGETTNSGKVSNFCPYSGLGAVF